MISDGGCTCEKLRKREVVPSMLDGGLGASLESLPCLRQITMGILP